MIDKLLDSVKSKRKVLIQTHNNPDPDAIATAFALKNLLNKLLKKRVTITYMGMLGRAENRAMVNHCKIHMHIMSILDISRYDYLIVVDAQPEAGNVFTVKNRFPDAVIDHHSTKSSSREAKFQDIRANYGSTSTIIAEYYKEKNIIPDTNTATALYYGIKSDTFGTGRENTQADMNMISYIYPYVAPCKLSKIENPDLPRYYFQNVKKAIENSVIIGEILICDLGEVRNGDLIAEMSDFLLRMRNVKSTCIIGKVKDSCNFSLRYKTSKKAVGHIAVSIVKGIGFGGGHMKSAGGQIPLNKKSYEEVVNILKKRLLIRMGIKETEEKKI